MEEEKMDGIQEQEADVQQDKDEVVPKKAYLEVTKDMLKYKKELREYQTKLEELAKQQKEAEEAKLAEQKKFEELARLKSKEAEELEAALRAERSNYTKTLKLNRLIQEIGELVKPEYINFANLDNIEVDENGNILEDSIKKEADRFKQEHPHLLKKIADNASLVPNLNKTNKITNGVQGMSKIELEKHLKNTLQSIVR